MFAGKYVQTTHDAWIQVWVWRDIDDSDDAEAISLPEFSEVSVQAFGTFGAGSVSIEGTLVPSDAQDAPNWAVLRQLRDGAPATMTAPDIVARLQNVLQIRPAVAGGAGPVTVYAMFSGPRYGH
jgi:hypothetical protein